MGAHNTAHPIRSSDNESIQRLGRANPKRGRRYKRSLGRLARRRIGFGTSSLCQFARCRNTYEGLDEEEALAWISVAPERLKLVLVFLRVLPVGGGGKESMPLVA